MAATTTAECPTRPITDSSRRASAIVRCHVGRVLRRPSFGIDQVRVKVLPALLILFAAVMVIEGVEHALAWLLPPRPGRAQICHTRRRLRATCSRECVHRVPERTSEECQPFVSWHKTFDSFGERQQLVATADAHRRAKV